MRSEFFRENEKGKGIMINFNVRLSTMTDVKEFCRIISAYPFEAKISTGNDIVDAKSILGIFSLNLTQEATVCVESETLLDLPEKIYKYMA